ncbi:MAG TPA: hypothetical protein VFB54_17705 [Burkholderiales bacterium]|nr:hypothetical protein [Burkholderiales bacterium]
MFLTPVYRDTAWQYTRSLVDTVLALERYGIHHRAQMVIGNSNLPRARNELAAEFLATDCTDAFLIDSDMEWQPNDVMRLLGSEQPLIGAVGRKRVDVPDTDPAGWCVRFLPGGREGLRQDELGAIEVQGVGTGFLKIERRVFEALIDAHPDWKRSGFASMKPEVREKYFKFFRFPESEEMGEDYSFCEAWRALGGSVWMDPEISIGHAGSHTFKGSISALFESATPVREVA